MGGWVGEEQNMLPLMGVFVIEPKTVLSMVHAFCCRTKSVLTLTCVFCCRSEGVLAFYKGILPNLLRVTPACCITFVVYENMIKWLGLDKPQTYR